MSDEDDPFGLTNDAGRTRIRPAPAQRVQPARPAQQQPPHQQHQQQRQVVSGGPMPRSTRNNPNILISAFAPLLELAPELGRADPPGAVEELRVQMLGELTQCRDSAVAKGAPLHRADAGAWYVGALIDDIVLNTPWGGNSGWPRQPLVSSMYGDVDAGTQFFERLEELQRYPNRDPELLEMAYMCLSLGFRGKYRVEGRAGASSLSEVRALTARLLKDSERSEAPLSPHWRGVNAENETPGFIVPIWAIFLGAATLITALYIGVGIALTGKAERLYDLARLLPPPQRAEIFRPIITTEVEEQVEEIVFEPVTFDLLPLIEERAPGELKPALSGREDVSTAVVVLQSTSPEVFKSARSEVNDVYSPLIAAVAAVITENVEVIGGITVVGHTDSIPVQRSNPFASNQGLSEARARTIADLLTALGVSADSITSEGRAASEPVADNGTREGRARNRRVEIKIQKRL